MTRATPRSRSATTKLALPSSGAGTASTVNTAASPQQRDRRGRQEHVDGEQRHQDRAPVKDHLRHQGLGRREAEVDQQVAQSMCEVEEGQRDQNQQVELHDRVAQEADPGVVMAIRDTHDAQRPENPLDQDVDWYEECSDHTALRKHEPPKQVGQSRLVLDLLAHRPNPMRIAPITTDATNHMPNIAATITPDGSGLSNTFT